MIDGEAPNELKQQGTNKKTSKEVVPNPMQLYPVFLGPLKLFAASICKNVMAFDRCPKSFSTVA